MAFPKVSFGFSRDGARRYGGIVDETDQGERASQLFEQMREKPLGELWEVVVQGDGDEKHAAAMQLQLRGGDVNFHKALEFCRSSDPSIRDKGAFILGQLGTPERPYSEQSAPVLINLLENDPNEDVRASAACALGHLGNPIAVPHLLGNAKHRSAEITRLGPTWHLPFVALMGRTSLTRSLPYLPTRIAMFVTGQQPVWARFLN